MNEKEIFLSLAIIGIALGLVGFSTVISGTPTGGVVANQGMHSECINGKCIEMLGEGNSECSIDDHCFHLECVRQQCTLVAQPGADLCFSNEDCYY